MAFLLHHQLQSLLDVLAGEGYQCVGPQVQDGAIVYAPLASAAELPRGYRDQQGPGEYRLVRENPQRFFAWANGPQALKPLVFAPRESAWQARRESGGALSFAPVAPQSRPTAVIGVRACDLAALALLDRHFLHESSPDRYYAARRDDLFLVAVNCTHPAATCFCASTGDGPDATSGYDLVLSELDDGFIIEAGSNAGQRALAQLQLDTDSKAQRSTAAAATANAAQQQSRCVPSRNMRNLLFANLESPHWEEVAQRCLACGNCTSVCPTCFCHAHREEPAIDGVHSHHVREWDSCFSQGHSYIHGLTVRSHTRERYRKWLVHKFGGWHDQFGRSGCTGCGRCITWCPVGIDVTAELAVLNAGGQGK
ncbi:MAG: 4Fe-4S dicluster domain-containing protein [Pseudomonadota bacterium]|nr:MAG: 4Fe-4S dicluster domain-containing protein [Pseudomonadota bacterium]